MEIFKTTLQGQTRISEDYYEMKFFWPSDQPTPRPGQFFTIRVQEGVAPLLRRPFAFSGYDSQKQEAAFIYQKRGPATEILTQKEGGDFLDIMGPVGNAFPESDKPVYSLAGGIGTGPMVFWANYLAQKGIPNTLILGVRNKNLLPKLSLEKDVTLEICTDDGSSGFKGNTVERLKELMKEPSALYGCGPYPMLKAMSLAADSQSEAWVSMEEYMACAVGACMGCVVDMNDNSKVRVCVEGPILDGRKIKWN